jgi:thiol-disulfide isomerase/thioredoxin
VNKKNRIPLIIGSVVLLIGLVLVLALVVANGDDGDDGATGTTAATSSAATAADGSTAEGVSGDQPVTIEANAPVVVTGDSLPAYDPSVQPDPGVGLEAPVVEGQSFDGSSISIGGQTDGPQLLVFLAHWCPHCNEEIPELLAVEANGGIPDELQVIGVSTAVAADRPNYPPSEWVVETGWDWPVMADSEGSEAFLAYGGSGFPYMVMLDSDGAVLSRQSGSAPAATIEAWIADTLG